LIFIKTLRQTIIVWIVAMHTRLPSWVKSGQTIAGQNPQLSAVSPIADKMLRCRECPL